MCQLSKGFPTMPLVGQDVLLIDGILCLETLFQFLKFSTLRKIFLLYLFF